MKKQIIGICALCLTLAAGVLILSCGPAAQNSNTVSNADANANSNVRIAESEDPCTTTNVNTKVERLKAAVEKKIAGDKDDEEGHGNDNSYHLKKQYNYSFFIDFAPGTGEDEGYAVATVTGSIQGKHKFKKLVDFIEDFVKKDCKVKVVFNARVQPSPSPGMMSNRPGGLEWCESPLIACPDGSCRAECDRKDNTNSNSNTSNANVNRPGNP
jgi:hypothetical protein